MEKCVITLTVMTNDVLGLQESVYDWMDSLPSDHALGTAILEQESGIITDLLDVEPDEDDGEGYTDESDGNTDEPRQHNA